MTTKSPTGSSETIQRAIRPCAVSVRTRRTQLHPVADVLGDLVDHLGGVRSGLALQPGDEGDLIEVGVLHPLGDVVQRDVERDAELLVGEWRDRAPTVTARRPPRP